MDATHLASVLVFTLVVVICALIVFRKWSKYDKNG
jgi:ABC-type antimicrobial peptide transport system permease subunit